MRVAVVGFGHLGNYHAQKVQGHSKAKLVGIVDLAEDRKSYARSQGYEVITDWKSENLRCNHHRVTYPFTCKAL